MDKQNFIESIAGYVRKYANTYRIMVHSPIIAQAILESRWGESELAAVYHNYFGLKCGTKWAGKSVNKKTMEEYQVGTLTQISDNFRAYDSMEEGVKGYFEFIQLPRYHNLRGITDPKAYLETIKADKYATGSRYVENIMAVIEQYNLTPKRGNPKWQSWQVPYWTRPGNGLGAMKRQEPINRLLICTIHTSRLPGGMP